MRVGAGHADELNLGTSGFFFFPPFPAKKRSGRPSPGDGVRAKMWWDPGSQPKLAECKIGQAYDGCQAKRKGML